MDNEKIKKWTPEETLEQMRRAADIWNCGILSDREFSILAYDIVIVGNRGYELIVPDEN